MPGIPTSSTVIALLYTRQTEHTCSVKRAVCTVKAPIRQTGGLYHQILSELGVHKQAKLQALVLNFFSPHSSHSCFHHRAELHLITPVLTAMEAAWKEIGEVRLKQRSSSEQCPQIKPHTAFWKATLTCGIKDTYLHLFYLYMQYFILCSLSIDRLCCTKDYCCFNIQDSYSSTYDLTFPLWRA